MRPPFIAAAAGGAALLVLWWRRRRSAAAGVVHLTAGAHVQDLLLAQTTWRDIRPRHPEALSPRMTTHAHSGASAMEFLPPPRTASVAELDEQRRRAVAGLVDSGPQLQRDEQTGRPVEFRIIGFLFRLLSFFG